MGRKDRIEALEAQVEAWVVVADRRRRQRDAARRERDVARAEVERLTAELRGGDEFARQAAATPPDAPRRMQANPGTGPVHGVEHEENSWCSSVPCVPVEPESVEPEPTPVEVGGWFKGPISGGPFIVREVGSGGACIQRWKGGGRFGQEWPFHTASLASWERCDPPTVEVGQWRQHESFGPIYIFGLSGNGKQYRYRYQRDGRWHDDGWLDKARVENMPIIESPTVPVKARDLKAGMVEAGTGRVVYWKRDAYPDSVTGEFMTVKVWWRNGHDLRRPDALYEITVDSLPDGWDPSGEGEA